MAAAKTLLISILLSLLLFHILTISIEEVQCLQHKGVYFVKKLQWRKLSHAPKCHPQKSKRDKGSLTLEMKHYDYCSEKTKNWDEVIQNRLISDNCRVHYLQAKIKKQVPGKMVSSTNAEIPLYSGVKLLTLNYIITLQLGKRNMTVLVDTGSDLTWVQCEPCKLCYSQQDPILNPGLSRSYKSVACNSSSCQSLEVATGFSGACGTDQNSCSYVVNYGDGSYTRGELGRERLYIGKTYVKDFVFGCGRNNKGLFGGASGLLGLGRNNLSLISQTYKKFDGVFSYCLPSTEDDSSGSLTFGRDASVYKNSTPISYTKLISNPESSTFYFLNLTGFSLGGVAIQAPGFATSRTLIDSGTVITRLVPSVYNALKAEFLKQFSGYPTAPSYSILDTCFNLTAYEDVNIPTLNMYFEEGTVGVNVDVRGMFYFAKADASQVCLALASLSSEDEVGIIGNFQQRNLRIVYDTKKSKVGFAEEACSYT